MPTAASPSVGGERVRDEERREQEQRTEHDASEPHAVAEPAQEQRHQHRTDALRSDEQRRAEVLVVEHLQRDRGDEGDERRREQRVEGEVADDGAQPASWRTKRKPDEIEARIDSPLCGWGDGSRSGAMAAMTARKLSALIANAQVNPPMAITMPASAGPITRPRFHCADPSAMAAGRSSRGTRSGQQRLVGREAERGGAPGQEDDDRDARPGGGVERGEHGEQRPRGASARVMVVSSRRRRGIRSASAPPSRPAKAEGTKPGRGDDAGPAGLARLRW